MGQMKELFISMQEGLLMGSRMDLQVRGRIADEEYQLSTKDSDEDAMAYIDEGHSEGTQYYTEKQALKTIKEILAEDEYLLDGIFQNSLNLVYLQSATTFIVFTKTTRNYEDL